MEITKIITGALEENCYILKKESNCIIVDPGSDSKKIKEQIGDSKILAIIVTHSHFDHIGALRDFLDDNRRLKVLKKSNLKDQEITTIGDFSFQTIYTPGHSSDSISFYFPEENVLFTGDFIFKDTIGRCDLPTGSIKEMELSLSKMKDFKDDLRLCPGHGEETTLGREREKNFYFQKN